jgi:hypothetical protein
VCYGVATVLHNATLYVRVDLDEERQELQRLQLATDPERKAPRGHQAIEADMRKLQVPNPEPRTSKGCEVVWSVRLFDVVVVVVAGGQEERERREELTDAFRGRAVAKGLARILSDLAACQTLGVHALLAHIFLALTLNSAHRGRLVQDGAHKALLSLARHMRKVRPNLKPRTPTSTSNPKALTL